MTAPDTITLEERCTLDFIRDLNPEAHECVRKCINRLLAERSALEAKVAEAEKEADAIAQMVVDRDVALAEARKIFAAEALEKLDQNALSVDRGTDGTYTTRIAMHLEAWLRREAEGKG